MRRIFIGPSTQRLAISLVALLIVVGALATRCHAQGAKRKFTHDIMLENLWNHTPADRLEFISKVVKKDDFALVGRGGVGEAVVERASLEAVQKSEIICKVLPAAKNSIAVIKWVVEDGTRVTKGQKLIEFDTTPYQDELNRAKKMVADAEVDLRKVEEKLARIRKDAALEVKLAEIEVKLAELALKQYKGEDALQKQVLGLQVDRASLQMMRITLQADVKTEAVVIEQNAKKTVRDRKLANLREIESNLANCVINAPHDGMAVYTVPEQGSGPGGAIIAQGEPVRDGQKMLTICDLKKMQAITRIAEAAIFKVRVGQKATIRVDAFPAQTYTGKVTFVSAVADQGAFMVGNVKVYRVIVAIDGDNDTLRPGMSAQTSITIVERANCLRVPFGSVLKRGGASYCYVQVDKELQVRKLGVGVSDDAFVEVVEGLNEGEVVLRNPGAIAERLIKNSKLK